MLIKFSVSNFLSINEKQEFSMLANKTRKNSERIYKSKNIKLFSELMPLVNQTS